MKAYALCPISDKKVNEPVARMNAAFTVLFVSLFISSQNILFVVFLLLEFFLRSTDFSKFSVVALSSRNIIKHLPVKESWINAGPKLFAGRIGLILSSLVLLSSLLHANVLAIVIAGILGLFSFLEAAFGLCVACEIYPFVYKFFYSRKADYTI